MKILIIFFLFVVSIVGQTKLDIIEDRGYPDKVIREDGISKYIYEKQGRGYLLLISYEFDETDVVRKFGIYAISKLSINEMKKDVRKILNKNGFRYLMSKNDIDYFVNDIFVAKLSSLKYLGYNTIIIETEKK